MSHYERSERAEQEQKEQEAAELALIESRAKVEQLNKGKK